MKKNILVIFFLISGLAYVYPQADINSLSPEEKSKAWILLFNGDNLDGWTSPGKTSAPERGWTVEQGILTVNKGGPKRGGDIITKEEFSEFDLRFEFRLSKAANSGVKYLFTRYEKGGWLGNEYQILDDDHHPDARGGRDGNRKTAAFYDVLPTAKKTMKPTGEWNTGRIVVKGSKVEHYLNGKRVLVYKRGSKAYRKAVGLSKFNNTEPFFGTVEKGYILLQDHQDEVSFRNIKIRRL